jgi:hypothetical protein
MKFHSRTVLPTSSHTAKRRAQRGSVLIVALVMAGVIAVSLGSYVQLSRTTLQIANRAYYHNVAMNLAETGLELGMAALASDTWGTDWSSVGSDRTALFDEGFNYGGDISGKVRVYVVGADGNNPRVLARSSITPPGGQAVEKWISVQLGKSSAGGGENGGRFGVRFSGGVAIWDSYSSKLGKYGDTLADGTVNRSSKVRIVSLSLEDDSFDVGNSKVYGRVSIGTPDKSGLKKNPNGIIGQWGDDAGTVRADHVTYDAKMTVRDREAPAGGQSINAINGAITIGSAAGSTSGATLTVNNQSVVDKSGRPYYVYNVPSISLTGNGHELKIADNTNVILVITGTSGTTLKTSGQGAIILGDKSTLQIFTSTDVDIKGNGLVNDGKPADLRLTGTRPQSAAQPQDIDIAGNGKLSAVVYAPNANVTVNGGGSSGHVYGSVFGRTVRITGGGNIHMDLALLDDESAGVMRVTNWIELTKADARSSYASKLTF